ncbi:hypothetical protein BGY98DRAFT_1095217 [Russula aff. rugulosa BPL654]|nr:hypothetical protein BGY98DRAFT_1095217 [Russula aff. rugulosa BPL654]
MAAVLAPSFVHSSSHYLAAHRDTLPAFHQHRGSAPVRKAFDAFASHHHSGANSRSAAASWRHSEPQAVVRQPAPARTPSPKYRRSGLSHSRTPSTSSEASSTSWRSHDRSPAPATKADVTEEPSSRDHLKATSPVVYSATELLRLSASPLVGISKKSQDIVDDLVAHHVWRRATSLQTSTDDSEHSD